MKELKCCLVCGSSDLDEYIDLGTQPLVNNLKKSPTQEDVKFPLVVKECLVCTHKQLSIAVEPSLLYSDYLYQSGTSSSHLNFFLHFVIDLDIPKGSVLDIGCNDGSLLLEFTNIGWQCLGIEPSYKLASECDKSGIEVINDFFPTKESLGKYDLITAFNVFAHQEDPFTFLQGMKDLLKENGRIYILTTPARLDNFYHEHISYFNLLSMNFLVRRCGLEIKSYKTVSMHGESNLFEIWHKKEDKEISGFSYFQPMVGYGASASEIVLFNYYILKPEYVVDDNELKQGKFIPGVNSPIVPCGTLKNDKRDLTIIVAHHLFDEISKKIKKLRPKRKDKFVRLI